MRSSTRMIAGTSRIRTNVAVDRNGDRQTDSDLLESS
jgi:hypothetical protein